MNTTSGSPHDFRKGDPEFFGWRILRVALEIAEPGITKEPGLFQECGWNRAYKKRVNVFKAPAEIAPMANQTSLSPSLGKGKGRLYR